VSWRSLTKRAGFGAGFVSQRQWRTQGGCTGCTCIPPPPPVHPPPGHVHPPPPQPERLVMRKYKAVGNNKKMQVCLPATLFKCRAVRYRSLTKSRCWNQSGIGIRGPSTVPECSGAELKWRMPDCRSTAMYAFCHFASALFTYLAGSWVFLHPSA
jgi:hypothetical protein